MKINSVGQSAQLLNVEKSRKIQPVKDEQRPKSSDQVEISVQAKKLAQKGNGISPERVKEIKQRIADGFYDRDEIIEQVAERILRSKDFLKDLQNKYLRKNI